MKSTRSNTCRTSSVRDRQPVSARFTAGARVILAVLAVLVLQSSSAFAQAWIDWAKQPQTGPVPRIEDTFVYDSVANRIVMFGGYDVDFSRMNDIWYYDGASRIWTDVTPPTEALPIRRSGQAMAFDPVRKVVVLFGGLDDNQNYLADTWEWNTVTNTWAVCVPATLPSARQGSRLVYDVANNRTILVGGVDANHYYNETWSWNGTTWTKLAVTTPASFFGRTFAGAAYNPTSGHGVTVFGGIGTTGGPAVDFNDIWELQGTTWTNVTPGSGSPLGRGWTQLAYDTSAGRMVMFGGYTITGQKSYGDTWAFSGGVWTQIVPESSGPGGRDSHGMVYDTVRNKTVVFGGYVADVLELTGNTWVTSPNTVSYSPGQDQHAMAYDSNRDVVLMYGGGGAETWELVVPSTTWSGYFVTGPNGRTGTTVAYESSRQKLLLFGGRSRQGGVVGSKLGDTWEWDTTARTWTNVTTSGSPQARDDHAIAYDTVHDRAVLFGGRDAIGNALGDTWLWTGTGWTNMPPAGGPSARFGHAMTYDAVRGVVALFGGDNGTTKFNDVWEWNGTTWTQIFPSGPVPSARSYAALSSFDAATPGVALFGGLGATQLNDTWLWNGTVWTQVGNGPTAPTARQHPVMVYDGASRRMVMYGGQDARGRSTELWTATITSSSSWPAPVSVTPSQGRGPSATFTAVYRHTGGFTQIRDVSLLINTNVTGSNAAYVLYTRSTNTFSLFDDGGGPGTSGTPGSNTTLSNSHVSINLALATASLSGTDITISLPLVFKTAFNGPRNVYLSATDPGGASPAGWQQKGTFFVSNGNTPPQMVSVAPSSGSGMSQTFTTVYRDLNGVSDLQQAYLLINATYSGVNAAAFFFTPANNTIFLASDGNPNGVVDWGAGAVMGSAVTLSNSQVSLDVAHATVSRSATDLILALPLTFTPAFAGPKNVYMFGVDFSGAQPSSFQQLGTFTVGASNVPATVVTNSNVNPSALGQTVTFTATVSGPGPTPTGTVTFLDGAAPMCSAVNVIAGQATCAYNALPTGPRSIAAAYSGDGNYGAATSPPYQQTVGARILTVTKSGTGSGMVTSNPPGVNCGIDCTEPYASTTHVTLTATPGAGSVFMGWLGACIGTGPCNVNVSAAISVSATFAPDTVPPSIDIDGNNGYDALTDGLLMIRYLFGLTGTALTSEAIGAGPTRSTPAEIAQHMDNIKPLLDVDGNGQADALTDGLMLIRYLFGLRGNSVIAGTVGGGATRTTAMQIETYIQSRMP